MSKHPPDLLFIPAPSTSKDEKKKEDKPKFEEKQAKPKKEESLKNRLKAAKNALEKFDDIDKALDEVKAMEEICSSLKCKVKIKDFSITCKLCNSRFCTNHYLPEVHGCGDAAKKDARQHFVHPGPEKLPKKKKEQCETMLHMKLKQMQESRKKTNTANSKKVETKRK